MNRLPVGTRMNIRTAPDQLRPAVIIDSPDDPGWSLFTVWFEDGGPQPSHNIGYSNSCIEGPVQLPGDATLYEFRYWRPPHLAFKRYDWRSA